MTKLALISNGDFRDEVNRICWPKQEETLNNVENVFKSISIETFRVNPFKPEKQHGFISTQAEGCRVISKIDNKTPVVVVLSSWCWANHLASSFKLHKGPILLLGNFDGKWPGLVALLNHSATFERMGITHSRLWTDCFTRDTDFMNKLKLWISEGIIVHTEDHITNIEKLNIPDNVNPVAINIAENILKKKMILGQMDPGCMGMLNTIMSPDKLAGIGMPIEYLNQSDLLAEMELVTYEEEVKALCWLIDRGATFHWGKDPAVELVRKQIYEQMKMYIAAGRIFERYGLSAIGIPYQYGLVRCTSASDLPEGMLNNSERPYIFSKDTGERIEQGFPIVHFNEGDLGSGVPQVVMKEILIKKGMQPESTLHDVRWGDFFEGKFVWVFEISGGAPPAHWGGWKNTHIYRQPPMYFPKGGGTCSGVSKPGIITWARLYENANGLGLDCGLGEVLELPVEEIKRRMEATTQEWPIANVYIPGYDRDQLMATHKSNHITICYGDILAELAAVFRHLGVKVRIIGDARSKFV